MTADRLSESISMRIQCNTQQEAFQKQCLLEDCLKSSINGHAALEQEDICKCCSVESCAIMLLL